MIITKIIISQNEQNKFKKKLDENNFLKKCTKNKIQVYRR